MEQPYWSSLNPTSVSFSTFWEKVDQLGRELQGNKSVAEVLNTVSTSSNVFTATRLSRTEIMTRIEHIVERFLEDVAVGQFPKFILNKRGGYNNMCFTLGQGLEMLSDVEQTEISLENQNSIRKFSVMMKTLSACYKLLQNNSFSTKRDIFYSDVNFFKNQHSVDEAVSDIACMIGVPRHALNVIASSKGCVAGNLSFNDDEGNLIDCGPNGVQVPSHIEDVRQLRSTARYILVIEKEATFRRLVDEKLACKFGPSILITGKGFPDVNTRLFLRRLWNELQIPVFALVDADPHGIEIMCIYRYGSRSLAFDAQNMTCPSLKWLGILPRDLQEANISNDALIPLSLADRKKAKDLLKQPYIKLKPDLEAEIKVLTDLGKKAEIECLDSVSLSFMTDIYLPHKLRSGGWI